MNSVQILGVILNIEPESMYAGKPRPMTDDERREMFQKSTNSQKALFVEGAHLEGELK